jgi:hypothetical protein
MRLARRLMAARADAFNDIGIVLCCDDQVKRSAGARFLFFPASPTRHL